MTTQLDTAVPTNETPGCRLQRQNIQVRDSMSSIEFLRSTGLYPWPSNQALIKPDLYSASLMDRDFWTMTVLSGIS